MANCHSLFLVFDDKIRLTEAKMDSLRTSRNEIRKKIDAYLKEHDIPYEYSFKGHGSFKMNTIINPLDGDYDIDDGTYFKVDAVPEQSVQTFHNWIYNAVENHTNVISDRNPCISVKFADGHHLDLVAFYQIKGEHPHLAHKTKGWIESDPDEFYEWINCKADDNGQLKRLIRYLKAWGDYRKGDMPSGLIMTILCAQNIVYDERDDKALLNTLVKIKATLTQSFTCYRPTTPIYQNLFEDYCQSRKDYFLASLDSIITSGNQAITEPNQKDSCPKWKKHFGDRFPCDLAEDKLDEAREFAAAAIIKGDGRSANC